MDSIRIQKNNETLLQQLSQFLNFHSDFINQKLMNELIHDCQLSKEDAFSMLLAGLLQLDIYSNDDDRRLYYDYFPFMIHQLNSSIYQQDPYYEHIIIPDTKAGNWQLTHESYQPYEAFVCDDMIQKEDGRLIPQIGFFDQEFSYPVVLQNNREWMLITPNEIETMRPVIEQAVGKVITYGLGLGYFAYMVSEKESVTSVTIVERDIHVISLFQQYILPQFSHKEKIHIICSDAFEFAKHSIKKGDYDFSFTDLWHDPSDGIDCYLKMKEYEQSDPDCHYMYWIEKTLLCYL